MNKLILIFCSFTILLTGCNAFAPTTTENVQHLPKEQTVKQPSASFTKDTLSSLLTAEFAKYRGQLELSLQNYVVQANKTKDPQVIESAYQMANYISDEKTQLSMALLWVSITPDNIEANRVAAIELAKSGQVDKATIYFKKTLANTTQLDFLALTDTTLTKKAQENILLSLDKLLITYPNELKLIYSKALLLAGSNNFNQALITLQKIPSQQYTSEITLLKTLLLQNIGQPDQALAILKKAVKENPNNRELRLNYANQLLVQGQLIESKLQFATLIKQFPEDETFRLSYALICMENKDWDEAITYLKQSIDNGTEPDVVYLYLGMAYREKGNTDLALQYYQKVTDGNNYLNAVVHSTKIYFDRKQISQAQSLLRKARKNKPNLFIPLYLFEIEQLLKLNKTSLAWQAVNYALKTKPNDPYLLYSRALVAEERRNIVQAEKDLRKVIKLEPQNAMAINALGYILTNNTKRYKEALLLIQQALKLGPNDPAILDSLGWVYYHLGNLSLAAKYLQQSYNSYADPEVAAHLGEVLWQQGKQHEAKTIWKKALTNAPSNRPLLETILRLTGKEL